MENPRIFEAEVVTCDMRPVYCRLTICTLQRKPSSRLFQSTNKFMPVPISRACLEDVFPLWRGQASPSLLCVANPSYDSSSFFDNLDMMPVFTVQRHHVFSPSCLLGAFFSFSRKRMDSLKEWRTASPPPLCDIRAFSFAVLS